ncbi:MAG TPA: zinc-dependent peptidase, partial [Flavobacteriales bacterium]|nr:zinc-dependent peptidase [Flavobacteriales bacterium]
MDLLPRAMPIGMRPMSGPEALRERLPAGAVPVVLDWLQRNRVQVRITPRRATKLGDYRTPVGGGPARISVNRDLNPYAFLVTLVHEFAHQIDQDKGVADGRPWLPGRARRRRWTAVMDEAFVRLRQQPSA